MEERVTLLHRSIRALTLALSHRMGEGSESHYFTTIFAPSPRPSPAHARMCGVGEGGRWERAEERGESYCSRERKKVMPAGVKVYGEVGGGATSLNGPATVEADWRVPSKVRVTCEPLKATFTFNSGYQARSPVPLSAGPLVLVRSLINTRLVPVTEKNSQLAPPPPWKWTNRSG